MLSLFSGIGAFEKALERLQIPFDLVGFSEIDKYAIKSYCAIHNVNENLNLGDVSKIDENSISDCDLMTWGFPCQDISIAGKQKGVIQGETRSGLYYEGLRILKAKKPQYTIIENVKALTQKKFKNTFEQILIDLNESGYNTYWKILNAKYFNIPQNRERIFIVGIRKDIDYDSFEFPKEYDSGVKLKDILENKVDEKYYINQEKVDKLLSHIKDFSKNNEINVVGRLEDMNGNDICKRIYSETGISPTVPTGSSGNTIPKIIQSCSFRTRSYNNQPQQIEIRKDEISNAVTTVQKDSMILEGTYQVLTYNTKDKNGKEPPQQDRIYNVGGIMTTISAELNGRFNIVEPNELKFVGGVGEKDWVGDNKKLSINYPQGNRIYDAEGISTSLTAQGVGSIGGYSGAYLIPNFKVRKLIPLECWRLMGFDDEDFYKAKLTGMKNSQLYKQAGNSIVVNVVESIMKNLLYNYIQYIDIA